MKGVPYETTWGGGTAVVRWATKYAEVIALHVKVSRYTHFKPFVQNFYKFSLFLMYKNILIYPQTG